GRLARVAERARALPPVAERRTARAEQARRDEGALGGGARLGAAERTLADRVHAADGEGARAGHAEARLRRRADERARVPDLVARRVRNRPPAEDAAGERDVRRRR